MRVCPRWSRPIAPVNVPAIMVSECNQSFRATSGRKATIIPAPSALLHSTGTRRRASSIRREAPVLHPRGAGKNHQSRAPDCESMAAR